VNARASCEAQIRSHLSALSGSLLLLPTRCALATSCLGQSINPKLAGLIGRHGPQNKQPFMVAFFKATEVHLRSTRSTGSKQRSQNRSKTPKNQEALRMASVAGTPGQEGQGVGPRNQTALCDMGREPLGICSSCFADAVANPTSLPSQGLHPHL
jgi:hypothetical protein